MMDCLIKTLVTFCGNAGTKVTLRYEERTGFGDLDPLPERLGQPHCTGHRLCGVYNTRTKADNWSRCPYLPQD